MTTSTTLTTTSAGDGDWDEALRAAAAFLAGFRSADTRKGYRRDLSCWLQFCAMSELHPYRDVRRTHVEMYLRQLEQQRPCVGELDAAAAHLHAVVVVHLARRRGDQRR